MGLLDRVNNLVETIKNAVSGGSSSNESSAHSSGGGTSSDAARSAAQAAAAKYQADGQKRTASTKSSTNNVLVDSVKHTPTNSGRTYSGTGTKAQNPEKAQNKAAAQTAADIAQQRGQSRTNYLKTYKTEESNYQAPKYKSSEDLNGTRANAYDPADRYIVQAEGARNSTVDYMTGAERKAAEKASKRPKNYLSEADFKQMDINDSYSPNWTDDKRLKETNGFQSVDDIADWGKNVVKAVGTSVGGSFLSNTGAAYEAGNGTDSWRTQEAVAQMNDAYQQALRVAVEQMNSADPDSYSDQLDAAKRELLAYAATIGNGMAEQVENNLTSAINQMKADPHNDHLFEYLLNNGNSGTLPDTTTFQGAALATRDMAREMFGQSQGYTEAAKAAAGNTTVGNILTDVAINLAEQGIDAAVGFLGSMGAAPQIASKVYQSISLGNMALRVFGQTASQVRDEGGNFGQQTFEAGLAAGVEVLTEKMSGGIAKFYGKGDTDEIVEEIARRVTQSDFGRSVIRTIGGMTGEAVEEIISAVVDPVVRAVHDSEATDKYATAEGRQEIATEAGYSALIAALAALAGSSATYINGSNAQANAALAQTDQIQAELESNGMSTKDARKVAPNVQKYQSEGFEGLSKSEQKTLTNPLIRSIYGIDIELDSATDTINKQTDGKRVKPAQVAAAEKTMSDRLTPEIFAEYKKFNSEGQTRETVLAAADAFNNELFDAVEGDFILDQNNRPVGTVKTVNDYGITIQYNDGSTESAVFMGNNGLLDPKSNLAKVFNEGGGVVAQEDADIIIRNAEQERKAQIKAGEAMQDRGEKAQPQITQQQTVPAPRKAPTPAKAQPTQQQAPQQEQQAPQTPQFQNQDVYDNTKYEVRETDDGYEVYNENGESVGTYDTYADAVGLVEQMSQNDTTQESPQNASQSVSQEEGNSVLPNEQNASEVQNDELNSKPERETTEDDEIREKRALTQDENDLEGRKDPLMSVTDSDGTSRVWGAEEETIDNIDSANQAYEVGGERFSAEDVQRMNPEDVLYRLTSWAKKLGFKGLRGFSEKLGKAITNITATTSKRGNVETQLIVDDNGAVKRQPDYSNRTNFDRDAYEESQSKENVNRSREDAAYMFLLNQDEDAKVSDVFNGLTSRFGGEKARAAQFILRRIFKNSGLNFETATVKEAVDYLAQKAQDTTQQTAENGISDEDLEEIFALLKRSEGLSVKFGNSSYVDLADILNGTAETTTVDDDTFSEADFHGESAYADAIAAIDEDIANIEEQIQDISESQDFGETPERKYQNVQRLQREIDRLTQRREWLLEQEERIANQADKNSRDTSSEIDMITASEEEAATNRAVEVERDRRPELGSISKDNASFVAAEDVPAAHKGKDATGNFSKVRGIRVDGEMYYALVSEKNGAYKHIAPDSLVEKAQNLFERLRNSIAEKQKTVDYYTAIVSRGETLTAAQEKNLDKTMKTLLALQQKLDKMVNGKYTFRNLWADASIPKDIRSYAVTDEAFRDFSVSAVATAVKESDAINGIRAMKGDSNDRSRTQSYQTDRGRNRLLRGQDTRNGFGADTGRLGTGKRQAGTQTSGTEQTNALLNWGGTQTSGTGVQTSGAAVAGNPQSMRTENGRQNNVGVSGQSPDAQSTRNPFSGRDNRTVFKDVSDAWSKSNGNTEDVTRDLVSKGYSVTTYRDGKTIVITDKQRPVGTFSNKDGRNTRLNNRLKNNPKFTAYSASKIAVIETDAYGKTTVEMKLGLLAFNRKTGETTLYAANVDSANHELNHDDWTLADNAISDRILGGENIDTIDDMFHNGLVKALDDIGVDYKTLSQYIQSLDYQADEVDEELFAELNAVMYEDSKSDWDGDTSISDIAHKLMQHEEFQNLVKQIRDYADEAERAAQNTQPIRYKQDLDQYSDESFDALVNDTSYEEASAINGQNYDEYDLDSEFNAEQASETETLNNMSGSGVDTTAAPIENFQNAEQSSENAAMEDLSGTGVDTERTPIDYFQSQEQASESDLIREQSRNDLTGSEDTNFESPYEAEQRTEQEAMDSLYENMDGRKLTSPKRTANDYYGSAYARVQETQKKHKRNKARSSFSIAELYHKTYGETNDSIRNFKRLQKLNSNVDSLLDGKMSYYDFNSFAKNMSSRQGIGQILNDDIQSELDRVVALEEAAQDKNASEQDVADFQYAAANVVSHIVARMDMVEKTERARARLDTAAKKHGAKGGRKNLVGTALDAWNRYQITGDNFWRMMDDWAGKGQGYSYAREHLKTIATRISEEAKLKGYFEGIDKNSKEFKDFASGTTMSNVDFNGHKISLMEGIKFVKTVDTLRMFASENGRPSWQRVAALGGFTFEGKNGKPIFVDIQGSYDNNAEARAKWVEQRYNQLKQEIANNKSASAYMSAVEEMYYEASKDAEKVHSKVNGYDRYMYGKGWYTDIHYAKKGDGSVDFRYSDRDATDVHDTASMQKRSKVAGGYAIINPMSRSVDAYISQISNYIAFEEFGQKLGVLSDSKSINGSYANTIRDAYGDQYAQWFDNYVKTMTLYKEDKPKGGMNSALAKARQAMMSGALIGSVSVPIKQVSSFFDTMGTLDPRAVAAVFVQNPLGRKQKGIKNYLMDSRNQSISDPDLAELFGDKGILRKIKDTRIGKLAISATNMMDATAVSNVYRACVLDVEYNNPLGKGIYNNGKNFKDGLTPDGQFYVDAKFEEALLGSQPIFTPQARNELARTDNQFARMFSTFRTQQTQNYNRMLQTWNEYQAAKKNDGDTKETGKKFVQTMTGQMIASASLSALTAIANAVLHKHKRYKDDDDELDEEKFWQRFGLGAFESLMGNSLFVGDITKWAIDLYNSQNDPNWNWKYSTKESQYFDAIEGMHIPIPASGAIGTAIQALNSAINLYRDVDENGWSDQNKLSARYLAGNIATAFGVQLNNVYNALNAGYQWYMDAAQLVTGNKKYEQKYDDIFTQMVKVDYSQQNRLVNSILAGKTQKVADMFDDMGQDKFENAVYYGAFDQYKAGKIDKAEYVELLMNFAGKSYKEASNEVEKKSRLLESGISQYNGIDGRDGRKAFYDQYSDNFQSRDAYKQFFEDVKNGKAEGKHNTYYTQWYGQPQEVSANQSSIIDTMNRNIQAGNFSYATAKLLWENYYGYSTSRYSAWKFVGK